MDITPYLKLMVEKNASDVFFTVNSPVRIKIEGRITPVGKTVMTPAHCEAAATGIMTDYHRNKFEENLEVDFAISLPDGSARFRVNVFRQRGEVSMVLRLIPSQIPTLEQFGLPDILGEQILKKRGLMLNHRNEHMTGHILTIEDPIEFSHPNKKSIINQREIGVDTFSYRNALRSSLREAPDVILIGEIRDRDTMEAALELSNTGHLAVSTLHANNANQAMERVINLFPQQLHKQLLMDLSLNIRAVISQRLVTGVDGKLCAAIEILINTPHIADLILKGDLDEIKKAMAESGASGMATFDVALFNLYKDGRIDLEEALNNADSRTNLEAKINFG